MDLNIFWFGIITALFIGFFFLEGFDFGVGILMPFVGKNDAERKLVISAIGPFWDANEVWMIVAGATMFAAFPHWYATMFSGFYLLLLLVLITLILRGVGFEFRNRDSRRGWHLFWDGAIFVGSVVPAFIWGAALTNLLRGVPIDQKMQYVGTLLDLLNPLALLGGAAFVGIFTLHGAIFLSLKTEGRVLERAQKAARTLWLPVVALLVAFGSIGFFGVGLFNQSETNPWVISVVALVALLLLGICLKMRRDGLAFVMTGLVIILTTITIFLGLFPRVMVSSLNPEWSLTIRNAASSHYSLEITSWAAISLLPLVIAYQAWNYWVFRKRVNYQSANH